ncbi:hypothetical protein [Bradyrhizobium stylosanthis]|nr:hypothetical protein [Bradyrhizobium stylosanthis]
MTLFVDPDDPAKFIQTVSGKARDFEVLSPDDIVAQLPVDEPALHGE